MKRCRRKPPTIMQLAGCVVSITLEFNVQESSSYSECAINWVSCCDNHIVRVLRRPDKSVGLVLESTATRKTTSISEDFQELIMCQSCFSIELAREHVRELCVKLDKLTSSINPLCFKCLQNGIGAVFRSMWRQSKDRMCKLPGQVEGVHH